MFADNLKKLRKSKGLTQIQFALEFNISSGTIAMWETGKRMPDTEMLKKIAQYFNVTVDYLLDNEKLPSNIIPLPNIKKVPLLGTIACGKPILAIENIQDYIDIKDVTDADFALRCKGDSMIDARIYDGDIVYIRQQPDVENGEIAAVLIDNEATLKRVYKYPDKNMVILKAANSKYEDFVYTENELENIKIIGKAVAFLSNIK